MELAYAKERQAVVDKYIRLQGWYEQVAVNIRTNKVYEGYEDEWSVRSDDDPLNEFDGGKFWMSCLDAELRILEEKYGKKVGRKHMWIGINPQCKDMKECYDTMIKMIEKHSYFDKSLWCVEAHTEKGYRPHIHLMIETKAKPHRIIETIAKNFKCSKNFVECKNYKNDILYNEHVQYILGNKTDNKLQFVDADKKEREDEGIPHYINNHIV